MIVIVTVTVTDNTFRSGSPLSTSGLPSLPPRTTWSRLPCLRLTGCPPARPLARSSTSTLRRFDGYGQLSDDCEESECRKNNLNPSTVCECCVFSSIFFWTSGLVDVPAGVTQNFSSTLLLRCLPYFFSRGIQPFLSLVDREVEFCVRFPLVWYFYFYFCFLVKKNPSFQKFELTSQRVRRRLSTELPGRPAYFLTVRLLLCPKPNLLSLNKNHGTPTNINNNNIYNSRLMRPDQR